MIAMLSRWISKSNKSSLTVITYKNGKRNITFFYKTILCSMVLLLGFVRFVVSNDDIWNTIRAYYYHI